MSPHPGVVIHQVMARTHLISQCKRSVEDIDGEGLAPRASRKYKTCSKMTVDTI